jgi:hypothetical protein
LIQQSCFKGSHHEKSDIYSERILRINSKVEKKTLERVFEETQGKRIITLESQHSNDEHSNEYSVA